MLALVSHDLQCQQSMFELWTAVHSGRRALYQHSDRPGSSSAQPGSIICGVHLRGSYLQRAAGTTAFGAGHWQLHW